MLMMTLMLPNDKQAVWEAKKYGDSVAHFLFSFFFFLISASFFALPKKKNECRRKKNAITIYEALKWMERYGNTEHCVRIQLYILTA